MKPYKIIRPLMLASVVGLCTSGFATNPQSHSVNDTTEDSSRLVNYSHEKASLLSPFSPTFPFSEILGACGKTYKLTFKNFNHTNFQDIECLKKEYFSLNKKSQANLLTTHFDSLNPFIKRFKEFLSSVSSQSPAVLNVIEDIQSDINYFSRLNKTTGKSFITFPFILDAHGRLIASFGNPGAHEKAVFWHATNPEYLFGLYENDAWKFPLKSFVEIGDFDNQGKEKTVPIYNQTLSKKILDIIDEKIKDKIHFNIHYPMYHQDKLGIPFLTYTALKRIYPFAYSLSPKGGAHGIEEISAAGMAAHDFVHAELDQRVEYLRKHIVETVDNRFKKSIFSSTGIVDAKKITEAYAPIAIERFLKIESIFQWFFEKTVTELLPQRGLEAFKKVMGGFFWVMRESIGFDHKMLEENGFIDVIDRYVDHSLRILNNGEDSWEVSSNPLKTNPFNGMSLYTDHEIIQKINQEKGVDNRYGSIKNATVTYDPPVEDFPLAPKYRFIDVTYEFMNGHEETYSFTTLYHRLTNIEDARNLLGWSGTKIAKIQDISRLSEEESTKITTDYIDTIRTALIEHINLFRDVFKSFALQERGGNPSQHQSYLRWSLDQERTFEKALKQEPSQQGALKKQIETIDQEIRDLEIKKGELKIMRLDFEVEKQKAIINFIKNFPKNNLDLIHDRKALEEKKNQESQQLQDSFSSEEQKILNGIHGLNKNLSDLISKKSALMSRLK